MIANSIHDPATYSSHKPCGSLTATGQQCLHDSWLMMTACNDTLATQISEITISDHIEPLHVVQVWSYWYGLVFSVSKITSRGNMPVQWTEKPKPQGRQGRLSHKQHTQSFTAHSSPAYVDKNHCNMNGTILRTISSAKCNHNRMDYHNDEAQMKVKEKKWTIKAFIFGTSSKRSHKGRCSSPSELWSVP